MDFFRGRGAKLTLGALVAALVLTGQALAADSAVTPSEGPQPAPTAYNWTGVYIGANVGGGWGRKNWKFLQTIPPGCGGIPSCNFDEGDHRVDGWLAGGEIGFNWQTGGWVFGAEAMADWTDASGRHNNPAAAGNDILKTRIKSLGLLTARAGYALDSLLLYGKGGGAWARDKYERAFGNSVFGPPGTVFSVASETRWGGTVGAGVEYGFAQNWSAGLEYDYVHLGTRRVRFKTVGQPTFSPFLDEDIRQRLHLLTFRVMYRFGG
ncbi:MAG TPA: outer membrane beta-barrel protein [Candidatus Binatia bacterium]|nr:outer membrane beta-barrel protein [Candidatus Binatia bacterium]